MDEGLWKNIFENELEDQGIPCVWSLYMEDNLQPQKGYLEYTQYTFARFACSVCSRWWNSAQVHILFLIRWDRASRHGTVRMKIFRQECKRCNYAVLETPDITKENIKRVISNLINKIQRMVYIKNNAKLDLQPVVYSDVEGPHDREHCEACKKKVCRWKAVDTGIKGAEGNRDKRGYDIMFQSAPFPTGKRVLFQENDLYSSWKTYNAPTVHSPAEALQDTNMKNGIITWVIIVIFIIALVLSSSRP